MGNMGHCSTPDMFQTRSYPCSKLNFKDLLISTEINGTYTFPLVGLNPSLSCNTCLRALLNQGIQWPLAPLFGPCIPLLQCTTLSSYCQLIHSHLIRCMALQQTQSRLRRKQCYFKPFTFSSLTSKVLKVLLYTILGSMKGSYSFLNVHVTWAWAKPFIFLEESAREGSSCNCTCTKD